MAIHVHVHDHRGRDLAGGPPATRHPGYGYFALRKSDRTAFGPHRTFAEANGATGGDKYNHVIVKHVGGGVLHRVNHHEDPGRPYKGLAPLHYKQQDSAKDAQLYDIYHKKTGKLAHQGVSLRKAAGITQLSPEDIGHSVHGEEGSGTKRASTIHHVVVKTGHTIAGRPAKPSRDDDDNQRYKVVRVTKSGALAKTAAHENMQHEHAKSVHAMMERQNPGNKYQIVPHERIDTGKALAVKRMSRYLGQKRAGHL